MNSSILFDTTSLRSFSVYNNGSHVRVGGGQWFSDRVQELLLLALPEAQCFVLEQDTKIHCLALVQARKRPDIVKNVDWDFKFRVKDNNTQTNEDVLLYFSP